MRTIMIEPKNIRRDPTAWPRTGLDQERVAEFVTLYSEGGATALPPIEVIAVDEGPFLLADGHHRFTALLEIGAKAIPVTVLSVPEGQSPLSFAYERGLTAAATVAKPLSRSEKRAAALCLIEERPAVTDSEIARLVGLSHQTVGRLRRRLSGLDSVARDVEAGDSYLAFTSADELAKRLVAGIERLWNARSLGEMLLGDQMGKRLARTLAERHGDDALKWAQLLESWACTASAELEGLS